MDKWPDTEIQEGKMKNKYIYPSNTLGPSYMTLEAIDLPPVTLPLVVNKCN